jgi:hypothetical protein
MLLRYLTLVDEGKITLEQWYTLVSETTLSEPEYGQLLGVLQQIAGL